ncbi:MAG TPA: ArsA-related P-loop ATPase [Candidatus Binataceae bacterium]
MRVTRIKIVAPGIILNGQPMLNQLLARRVLIVLGKGGVGKTTLSAALALVAADSGARVLAMECDPRAPMAAGFGRQPAYDPVAITPKFSTMVLDGAHALEEYLGLVVPGRAILRAVFHSRLYQFFVQAAPGLKELMMLGKIYYEIRQKSAKQARWDLIILDAPASGQALSLLRMPTAARGTFGESIVGHEAHNIIRMLHDRRICAIAQVTTADSLALSETIETCEELHEMRLAPAAIFFNRLKTAEFDGADIGFLKRHGSMLRNEKQLGYLTELARHELERIAEQRAALARLRKEIAAPVIEVPELRGVSGDELAKEIASGLASAEATTALA